MYTTPLAPWFFARAAATRERSRQSGGGREQVGVSPATVGQPSQRWFCDMK
ncbi:MAG: hypothetical protein U1F77_11255 [Kiritimatiellia bacterium]